ncbi:MAG: argininosuccinate synthase [Candidatus Brocadiia bacterium]
MSKVVLAYSGGTDTSICVHWLQSKGLKVITFMAQLGQLEYLEPLGEKAVQLGAETAYIADLRHRFVQEFILPCIKAGAKYESDYLLSSALTRPLISQELVRISNEENCRYVAHGSRGFGNDYIRFNNCIKALDPEIEIIAPLKELNLQTINDDIKYAQERNIPLGSRRQSLYNLECNLWGCNIQLGQPDELWQTAPRDTYIMTTPIEESPDKAITIEITFKKGEPIALNNAAKDYLELIEILNKIGGRHAIGRSDIVENKISGDKSREIYESPAASILYNAFHAISYLVLPKELLHFQATLSQKYSQLVYHGDWFSPLRESMDAFFNASANKINGKVTMKLFKGNCIILEIEK